MEKPQYLYPPERMGRKQLELVGELSVSHAVDGIVPLDVDPEEYKAQGAYRMSATPLGAEFLEKIAKAVYKRAPRVLEMLQSGEQSQAINRVGKHLSDGDNIMMAIPHSSIPDIGLAHGLSAIALRKLGYTFRSGIVVSQGVTRLARKFDGRPVPLPDTLGFMCDAVWFVYPRTDKTAESEFAKSVPPEALDEHNTLVKENMNREQNKGRMFLTSAVNATSYMRGSNGEYLLAGMTGGTIKLMTHQRTLVQRAVIELAGANQPVFKFCGEPLHITDEDEAHDIIGLGMAAELNAAIPNKRFVYLDPRLKNS